MENRKHKRILFIERSLDPTHGGVERVSYVLAEEFEKEGYQSYFLFCEKDSELIPESRKQKFNTVANSDTLYSIFSNFIERNKIEIIICQNIHTPIFHPIYKKLKDNYPLKFITCFHGNPDMWVNKNKWGCTTSGVYIKELIRSGLYLLNNPFKTRLNGMYSLSDRFVLLSDAFIPVFKNWYQTDDNGEKLVAISNPCSFSGQKNEELKENIVLVVARMAEQQKRISNVLKIWKKLYQRNENWQLVLVGDGPDFNLYKRMSSSMDLKNIIFVGHSPNVAEFYKKAKIFLMTSIWEGLPMTLIEAQYYGCVPIAFNSFASLADIIENGKNGFIVESNNIEQFCNQTELLMTDEALRIKLSENAVESVKNKFEGDIILNQWLKIL